MTTIDFDFFLSELKKGEIMDETYFYFVDETDKPEHYIGCLSQYDKPYWVGLCDIPDGTEFLTAEELEFFTKDSQLYLTHLLMNPEFPPFVTRAIPS